MGMIMGFILEREALENEIEKGTDRKKIAQNRVRLCYLAEDTRDIFGEAASTVILTATLNTCAS
jgi:hypothetical protein